MSTSTLALRRRLQRRFCVPRPSSPPLRYNRRDNKNGFSGSTDMGSRLQPHHHLAVVVATNRRLQRRFCTPRRSSLPPHCNRSDNKTGFNGQTDTGANHNPHHHLVAQEGFCIPQSSFSPPRYYRSPHRLTFPWWGCCGLYF